MPRTRDLVLSPSVYRYRYPDGPSNLGYQNLILEFHQHNRQFEVNIEHESINAQLGGAEAWQSEDIWGREGHLKFKMNAQVSFLEGELNLVHIPLELYSTFLQPILQVLLPQGQSLTSSSNGISRQGLTVDHKHGFLNISITPVECSIVCHAHWATHIFRPFLATLPKETASRVSISKDLYAALCVISAGMDAGSRVVDLSSPLALAGVPIFFITTYYSDFILVPCKDRQAVVQTLLARGFEFSETQASFVVPSPVAQTHPTNSHSRGASAASDSHRPPTTPPPASLAELQTRAFELLKRRNVVPYIDPNLHLVHCSGKEVSSARVGGGEFAGAHRPSLSRTHTGSNGWHRPSWADTVDTKLYTCLVAVLATQPRFLSLTLAEDDQPSLFVDKTLLPMFGDSLVGDAESDMVPIFLDLVNLPFEATGIVSGVAGKLVEQMSLGEKGQAPDLSYLSTSKAGAVVLDSGFAKKALDILQPLLREV